MKFLHRDKKISPVAIRLAIRGVEDAIKVFENLKKIRGNTDSEKYQKAHEMIKGLNYYLCRGVICEAKEIDPEKGGFFEEKVYGELTQLLVWDDRVNMFRIAKNNKNYVDEFLVIFRFALTVLNEAKNGNRDHRSLYEVLPWCIWDYLVWVKK
ncbi:hypothetical protein [Shimazuella alba]|uniref:Uncharacterized protein n=1 Tax=Shimazuella alba TaxID=2690964 RepID=A0A6I4VPR1_9BACL|nr:hypothetical protein [Shimazuella alba]MXQ53559.1 hypothetical protein [Shimazuella alba]